MSTTTPQVRSRYLLFGRNHYRTKAGRRVRLGYSARTGTTFPVDEEVIRILENGDLSRLGDDDRRFLTEIEAAVPSGEDELDTVVSRMNASARSADTRVMTIMPTAYCNMTCDYCGQEHRKGAVDQERVGKAIRRCEGVIAAPETRSLRVMWFGGEPLLALRVIQEMSRAIMQAVAEHEVAYSATVVTNGSLLTRRVLGSLYEACGVRNVEVTIDGPAEIHDARRTKRNGTGSFRHIVRTLGEVVHSGDFPELGIGIRTNIDKDNEEHVADLIADLACHGVTGPRVQLRPAPVHSWGNDVSQIELGKQRYAEQESEWIRFAHALGLGTYRLPSAAKRTTCIATTRSSELIDPGGGVYSCSEHPLVPRDRLRGRIIGLDELGTTARRPAGMFDGWFDEVADNRWPCGRCPFLPVCGGACPKLWHDGAPPCPSYKHHWETLLDLSAAEMGLASDDGV